MGWRDTPITKASVRCVGAQMATRKLTPEMVEEANELLLTGVPMDAVAMINGVSEATMRRTLRHFHMYGDARCGANTPR